MQPVLLTLEATGLPRAHRWLSADEPRHALPALQASCSPGDESLWKVWLLVEEEFGSKAYRGCLHHCWVSGWDAASRQKWVGLGWEGSGTHCSEVSGGTGECDCVLVRSYPSRATMS